MSVAGGRFADVCIVFSIFISAAFLQVMVFVHARNATVKTAMAMCEMAKAQGDIESFTPEQSRELGAAEKQVGYSQSLL